MADQTIPVSRDSNFFILGYKLKWPIDNQRNLSYTNQFIQKNIPMKKSFGRSFKMKTETKK